MSGTDGETERLVAEARNGSRGAFDRLIERFQDHLERYIGARLGPALKARIEPEDVLQETLLRAFCSIGSLQWRDEEAFAAWLRAIAERVLQGAAGTGKGPLLLDPAFEPPARGIAASRALRREERFERLRDALANLPPEHREVILLSRIERMSFQEIGERMGRSTAAAKQLFWRALKGLREAFGHTESIHLPDRPLRREDLHGRG